MLQVFMLGILEAEAFTFSVKKEIPTLLFLSESCVIFKKAFFTEHLQVTASV